MQASALRREPMNRVASVLILACLCSLAGIVVSFLFILIRHDFALYIGALLEKTGPSELIVSVLIIGLTPIVLMAGWRACTQGMSPGQRGVLGGLTFGLWALSCAIVVPWLGAYPVVWALPLTLPWGSSGLGFWLTLYILNLIGCPLAGLLYFRRMDR